MMYCIIKRKIEFFLFFVIFVPEIKNSCLWYKKVCFWYTYLEIFWKSGSDKYYYEDYSYDYYNNSYDNFYQGDYASNLGVKLGLNAMLGMEFMFERIPLTLQLDFRPGYGFYYNLL